MNKVKVSTIQKGWKEDKRGKKVNDSKAAKEPEIQYQGLQ
jgi:hypothetical protein